MLARGRYQGLDVGLLAHIAAHGQTSKLFGQGLAASRLTSATTTARAPSAAKRDVASNAAGAAGDDDDDELVPNPHVKVARWLQAVC